MNDIAYNIGLSLLVTNRAEEALKYFSFCMDHFSGRPHLWIRLAECYLRVYMKYSTKYFSSCRLESLSTGASKRIMICPTRESTSDSTKNDECLPLAKNCLFKGLQLIQEYRNDDAGFLSSDKKENHNDLYGPGDVNGVTSTKDESDMGGDEKITTLGLSALEETCIMMLIYIAMESEDYIHGIYLCKEAMKLHTFSEKNLFMVELILCEALCLSGNTEEALNHLNPTLISQDALSAYSLIFDEFMGDNEVAESIRVGVITSLYRAVYLIHAGKLKEALPLLESLFKTLPENQHVIKALLYCQLRCGKKSQDILKVLRTKRLL